MNEIISSIPKNGVTMMPISAQRWEAEMILNNIEKLKRELSSAEALYAKRMLWITTAEKNPKSRPAGAQI